MSSTPGRWQFSLASSADLSIIGPLVHATGRTLSPEFNRPGTFSATLPIDSPVAALVHRRSTCIIAERNGVPKWSGAITSIVDDAAARTTQIAATGWQEELDHRFVRQEDIAIDASGVRGMLHATGDTTKWDNVNGFPTDASIVAALVAAANSQQDTSGSTRPTHVTAPAISYDPSTGVYVASRPTGISSTARSRSYKVGDNIGQSIRELSDIEDGCDLIFDPVKRFLLPRSNTAFVDRTSVHFSLGADVGTNLQAAVRTDDGTTVANRVTVAGSGSVVVPADDTAAINDAGVMLEEWDSISDVSDATIIGAYANAELVYKRYGITTYSLTPMPAGTVPRLYDDFELGDQVYFSVNAGRFNVVGQAIRIFSASITIDDAGNEVVGELGVSPASG